MLCFVSLHFYKLDDVRCCSGAHLLLRSSLELIRARARLTRRGLEGRWRDGGRMFLLDA